TYKERNQLLHNEGNGTFREITDPALLGGLAQPAISRGLAVGDYDNDGRLDVLILRQNDPAQLLRNQDRSGNHWVAFQTVGTKSNRDGYHARFRLEVGSAKPIGGVLPVLVSTVRAGSSYLSHSDRRVYFGLGSAEKIQLVVIVWPSGTKEVLKD